MRSFANGVAFVPTVLAKQSRQGKPIEEFFFPLFPIMHPLPSGFIACIPGETKGLRGQEMRLFVSFIRLHKAITASSFARWLKSILEEAGIDIDIWS